MEDSYIKRSFVLQIEGRYRQWDIIARVEDGYLVMSHEIMHHVSFGDTNRWKDCFIRNYLHDVWLRPIRESLELKNIDSGEILNYRTESTNDRIFILSKEEHTEWKTNVPLKSTPYWLRSSYGHLHTPYVWIVSPDGHHIGEAVHSAAIGVVPVMYLSERAIHQLVGPVLEAHDKPITKPETPVKEEKTVDKPISLKPWKNRI